MTSRLSLPIDGAPSRVEMCMKITRAVATKGGLTPRRVEISPLQYGNLETAFGDEGLSFNGRILDTQIRPRAGVADDVILVVFNGADRAR